MRRTIITILFLNVSVLVGGARAQDVPRNSISNVRWHWFEKCDGGKNLGIAVFLDGKVVYRSRFSVCRINVPTVTAKQQKLVFRIRGGHVFQDEYHTLPTQTIDANIWQAGAEPDALLLGVSFVSDRVLLNTIHVAKPDAVTVSKLDRGIVVRTFPLVQK